MGCRGELGSSDRSLNLDRVSGTPLERLPDSGVRVRVLREKGTNQRITEERCCVESYDLEYGGALRVRSVRFFISGSNRNEKLLARQAKSFLFS